MALLDTSHFHTQVAHCPAKCWSSGLPAATWQCISSPAGQDLLPTVLDPQGCWPGFIRGYDPQLPHQAFMPAFPLGSLLKFLGHWLTCSVLKCQTCSAERQELMAVGSRHFGHPAISSLIRVKIYDFAMYMDGGQVRNASCKGLHVTDCRCCRTRRVSSMRRCCARDFAQS